MTAEAHKDMGSYLPSLLTFVVQLFVSLRLGSLERFPNKMSSSILQLHFRVTLDCFDVKPHACKIYGTLHGGFKCLRLPEFHLKLILLICNK